MVSIIKRHYWCVHFASYKIRLCVKKLNGGFFEDDSNRNRNNGQLTYITNNCKRKKNLRLIFLLFINCI